MQDLHPFLELLRVHGREKLICQLRHEFGPDALSALRQAEWLEQGAPARHYPCLGLAEGCRRTITPLAQPSNYDLVAMPPKGNTCCEPKFLIHADVRTLRASEPAIFRALAKWLPFRLSLEPRCDAAGALLRLGNLEAPLQDRPVFFARNLSESDVSDRLDVLRAAVVIAPTRGSVAAALLQRPTPCNVKLLFLEDYLRLHGESVQFPPLAQGALESSPTDTAPHDVSITRTAYTSKGILRLGSNVGALRALQQSEWDLFVDGTVTMQGGHPCRRMNGVRTESFVVPPAQVALLAELVRAQGKALSRRMLEGVRRDDLRALVDVMNEVRALCDVRPPSGVRAIVEHRGPAGDVSHFSFRPSQDFRFAILLPTDYFGQPAVSVDTEALSES